MKWSPQKSSVNQDKHGIAFADAVSVFEDEYALTREDWQAEGEARFITLGLDAFGRLLVVVYTYRGGDPDYFRAQGHGTRGEFL